MSSKKGSQVQSIIFGKNWNITDARKWLKKNNFKPIGRVKKSNGSKKYTIKLESSFNKPLGFKPLRGKGISLILGSLK